MRGATTPGLVYPGSVSPGVALAWLFYAGAIYLFLYAPLAVLVVLSFNDTPNVTLPWEGFTWRWYARLAANRELLAALGNSVQLGLATVAIAVPIGVLAAYAFRRAFALRNALFNLILVAVIAPPIIVGVGQSLFWHVLGVRPHLFGTTLVAHVVYATPFVSVVVFPALHRFPRAIEEAALDLGATPARMFLTVVLPIVKPGVVAASVFAFMLSFDEFIRTYFVIGVQNTLPIYLWSMIMSGVSPETNAIATVIIVISVVLMLTGYRLMKQEYRADG